MPRFAVVLCAAGIGRRMGGLKKAFAELRGRPALHHCIERLRCAGGCGRIVVVVHPDECAQGGLVDSLRPQWHDLDVVCGGATRQTSARAGVEAIPSEAELVLIHDAARPLVSPRVVERVALAASRHGAAIAAVRATETVKEVQEPDRIVGTPARERLWYARTPQGFRRELILRAHTAALADGFEGTDDAQLVERLGETVYVVEDRHDNLKITVREDLPLAEAILRWQEADPSFHAGRSDSSLDSGRTDASFEPRQDGGVI